jgi:hypothetical protein
MFGFDYDLGQFVPSRRRLHLALQHPNTRTQHRCSAQKSVALLNENDYHFGYRAGRELRPAPRAISTGGSMRTRQDIWLDWATGILVALGVVAIASGTALIAWMSLHPL